MIEIPGHELKEAQIESVYISDNIAFICIDTTFPEDDGTDIIPELKFTVKIACSNGDVLYLGPYSSRKKAEKMLKAIKERIRGYKIDILTAAIVNALQGATLTRGR